MEKMSLTSFAPRSILYFLVLLLEIGRKSRSVSTSVRLSCDRDSVIIRLVFRKFLKPDLGEVPESSCRVLRATGGEIVVFTGIGANVEAVVL